LQLPTPEPAAAEHSRHAQNPGEYLANTANASPPAAAFVRLKMQREKIQIQRGGLIRSDQMEKEAVFQILNVLLPPGPKHV